MPEEIMPHQKTPAQYGLNELNKMNTFNESPSYEFSAEGFRFRIGFWRTHTIDAPEVGIPYLALIYWTAEGWVVLDKLAPFWNDDHLVGTFSDGNITDQIESYCWWIAKDFNVTLEQFLQENAVIKGTEEPIPDSTWGKVLARLKGVYIDARKLIFPKE